MKAEIKKRIEYIKNGIIPQGYIKKEGLIYPEDWELKKLKDLLKERKEKNTDLKIKEVFSVAKKKGVINQIEHLGKNMASDNISTYKIIRPNDIIYTKSPTAGFPYGIIKQNRTNREGIVSVLYGVFIPSNKNLGFIIHEYFLSEINTFNYLNPIVNKGAKNTMNISNETFLDWKKIRVPTNEQEQEKMVYIITKWDSFIEEQERLIEKKKENFKIIQTDLLYGRKRFKCFSETNETFKSKIGTVTKDKSWKIVKVKSFFRTTSIRNRGSEELLSVTQDRGVIPRTMLDGNVTMPEGTESSYKFVKNGNFIISLRSFQGGVEYSEYNGLVSPAYTVIEPVIPIDDLFYKYLFKNTDFINRMSSTVVGIRDGKQINFKDFGELYIQLPPLEEQQKISQLLFKINEEILLQEKKLNLIRKEKKIFMQLLLTGIIRV